jgi:hypothetical protein
MNFVSPKAGAKHEFMFIKMASELNFFFSHFLNKSSALDVTKFIVMIAMNFITLCSAD